MGGCQRCYSSTCGIYSITMEVEGSFQGEVIEQTQNLEKDSQPTWTCVRLVGD